MNKEHDSFPLTILCLITVGGMGLTVVVSGMLMKRYYTNVSVSWAIGITEWIVFISLIVLGVKVEKYLRWAKTNKKKVWQGFLRADRATGMILKASFVIMICWFARRIVVLFIPLIICLAWVGFIAYQQGQNAKKGDDERWHTK